MQSWSFLKIQCLLFEFVIWLMRMLLIPKQPFNTLTYLFISMIQVLQKILDKRDDFDFCIVNFPFLDCDALRRPSYGVYISRHIRFARARSHISDFNNHDKFLTANSINKVIGIMNSAKHFQNFTVGTLH